MADTERERHERRNHLAENLPLPERRRVSRPYRSHGRAVREGRRPALRYQPASDRCPLPSGNRTRPHHRQDGSGQNRQERPVANQPGRHLLRPEHLQVLRGSMRGVHETRQPQRGGCCRRRRPVGGRVPQGSRLRSKGRFRLRGGVQHRGGCRHCRRNHVHLRRVRGGAGLRRRGCPYFPRSREGRSTWAIPCSRTAH